jgi:hypothetical protein
MSFERSWGLRNISCMCSVVKRHVLAWASAIVLLNSSDICVGSEKKYIEIKVQTLCSHTREPHVQHTISYVHRDVRFKVITVINMNTTVFWDWMPCNLKHVPLFWLSLLPPSSGHNNKKQCLSPHTSEGILIRWINVIISFVKFQKSMSH